MHQTKINNINHINKLQFVHDFFLKYPGFYQQCQFLSIGSRETFYDLLLVGVNFPADKFKGCLIVNESSKFDLVEAFLQFKSKCPNPAFFKFTFIINFYLRIN